MTVQCGVLLKLRWDVNVAKGEGGSSVRHQGQWEFSPE